MELADGGYAAARHVSFDSSASTPNNTLHSERRYISRRVYSGHILMGDIISVNLCRIFYRFYKIYRTLKVGFFFRIFISKFDLMIRYTAQFIGSTSMDHHFTTSMLPWVLAEIRRSPRKEYVRFL